VRPATSKSGVQNLVRYKVVPCRPCGQFERDSLRITKPMKRKLIQMSGQAAKCNSPYNVPITLLLYDGPLLYGFNVAIKGLNVVVTHEVPHIDRSSTVKDHGSNVGGPHVA